MERPVEMNTLSQILEKLRQKGLDNEIKMTDHGKMQGVGLNKIYNPEDGKEYNCKMTLKDPNTLEVRGYVGISLFGKTQTWTRIK